MCLFYNTNFVFFALLSLAASVEFVVGTTKLINGKSFIQSLSESLDPQPT